MWWKTLALRGAVTTPTKLERLESSDAAVPLLTELMVAHLAIDIVPEVRVRTRDYDAILTRSTQKWTFVKR